MLIGDMADSSQTKALGVDALTPDTDVGREPIESNDPSKLPMRENCFEVAAVHRSLLDWAREMVLTRRLTKMLPY